MEDKKIGIFKRIILVIVAILKSLWDATIHIVWGIATMFLLMALINYYKIDTSAVGNLLKLTYYLMDYWGIFWWLFFLSDLYINTKELSK